MYNIIQLREKELSELQEIANELGIKKSSSLEKDDLIFKILDEQAIAEASKKSAETPKKRSRVTVKQAAGKVYTATQDKAKKIDEPQKTVITPVVTEEPQPALPEATPEAEVAPEAETAPEAPAPKKRGRKPGSKNKPKEPVVTEEAPAEVEAPAETPANDSQEATLPFAEEPVAEAVEAPANAETAEGPATEEPAQEDKKFFNIFC